MRRIIVVLLTLFALVLPVGSTFAQDRLCFPGVPGITNCIEGRFRDYWQQNGGLPVFGYPITAAANHQTAEGTFLTQYFERNRFELHPEKQRPYDVLLGRLGDDRLKQQGRDWKTLPKATPDKAHFFAETGHAIVHEPFWRYWSTHGLEFDGRAGKTPSEALALFGLPLSEPTMETNASGDSVLTQWFERARFEDHGDKGVLLGLLGADVRAGTPGAGPAPAPPAPTACSDVPASVSGAVRPSNCVVQGTEIEIDIQGFRPNEELRFTITAPDGTAETLPETLNIGPDGGVSGLPLETGEIDPGLWTLTFEGITSGHRALIYFKILPPGSQPAPPPHPEPTEEPGDREPPPPSFNNCQEDPRANEAPDYPIEIIDIDKDGELVTLKNVSDAPVSLAGWRMCSLTGNQHHPISGSLAAGESKSFPSGSQIWNNSDRDDGALYNPNGQLISYYVDE